MCWAIPNDCALNHAPRTLRTQTLQLARGKPTRMFYCLWKGFPLSEATWEPEANVSDYWIKLWDEHRKAQRLGQRNAASADGSSSEGDSPNVGEE